MLHIIFVSWAISGAKLEPRGVAWSLSVLFGFVLLVGSSCISPLLALYCIRRLNHLTVYGGAREGWQPGRTAEGVAYPACLSDGFCLYFTRYGWVFPHSGVLTGHACMFTDYVGRDYLSVLLNHRRMSLLFLHHVRLPLPSALGLMFGPLSSYHKSHAVVV
ncbi:hypothetical protein BDP55DRAFT_295431 [Colletotrichum godetiae]|uniref:Uncharacterized protein n=1 Tax=Colletotrichum godetiae TaxID=1209918 RepID=A0AAJ0EPA0_9PEZI|nr:uncharacterized protein BDP55DRAFT_295431 [Colletotrichum godetiae]KAK1671451.1 hypothetical protein BDP55DRAFT_295431 [Colletotrichum godetiae]